MNVIDIPFVKKVGIQKSANDELELPFSMDTHNHLQTMHASAQFTLAETASGELLQTLYPDLVGKVIPVLREAEVKFKKPALRNVIAYPSISDEAREKFERQFETKGRASLAVAVELKDSEGTITCIANYNWFIQRLES